MERLHKGSYRHSYSSFDAAVVTPDGHERLRWHFQVNRHADATPRLHTSTWPRDDPGNRRFLRLAIQGIQPNDTIQIIPKAHFLAWRNHVLSAAITIKGEGDTPLSQQKHTAITAETFYTSLDNEVKEIRVLEILPGSPDSPLVCRLAKTSLVSDQHRAYEALSYVWGDNRRNQTIQLNGRPFEITINLHAALKRLRNETNGIRAIWADAICINQADISERSSQVQMMGLIYSKALRVIVWLGQLRLNVHEIRRLHDGIAKVLSDQDNDETSVEPNTSHRDLTFEESNAMVPGHYFQASQLLELPWFRRVWVLQEVFNAREIVAHCGTEILPWSIVLQINMAVNRRLAMPGPSYARVMPAVYSELFSLTMSGGETLDCLSYRTNPRPDPERLLEFFIAGLDLDATDPRDKIFALLNIFPKFTDAALQPDYGKDVSTVFCEFTRWWIVTHKSLRILSAVHCAVGRTWQKLSTLPVPSDRANHPSWALSWFGKSAWGRASLALFPDTNNYASDKQGHAAGSPQTAYRASRNTIPDIALLQNNINPRTICVKGIRVGIIDGIEPFPFYNKNPNLDIYRPAYERLFDPINQRAIFVAGSIAPTHTKNRPRLAEDHRHAHASYLKETGGAVECHTPCFFSTHSGGRGLCPSTACAGDIVVVLYGGDVPYLLRNCDGGDVVVDGRQRFTFVGECFLRGNMKGQALKKFDLEPEVFELF